MLCSWLELLPGQDPGTVPAALWHMFAHLPRTLAFKQMAAALSVLGRTCTMQAGTVTEC
jgi:hypothetical protein